MATKTFNARVQNKRDTSANWTANDPVLLDGEIIIVDTASGEVRYKVGDGVKKYSQLPFSDEAVKALISALVPSGVVMMWSGSANAIPSGYVICDGNNSTPDLRNRFVIGAGDTYAVGATGGSSATTSVGDVEAGPQATVSTSVLPPYYALCYIMKT
jgi:hypothetical protein